MWNKHYSSMYEGSMVGSGAVAYALMGYVIAKMECHWRGEGRAKIVTEATVNLNVTVLATIIGEPEEAIRRGIEFLCAPDPKSRTKDEEGRRLVKVGEFEYRVVNAPYYQSLRDKEEKREKDRVRQRLWREKNRPKRKTGNLNEFGQAHEGHLLNRPNGEP